MKRFGLIILGGLGGVVLLGILIFSYGAINERLNPKPTPYDLNVKSTKDLPKVNFSQTGQIAKMEGGNTWKFVYQQNGETKTAILSFSPRSVCKDGDSEVDCLKINVSENDTANIDGILNVSTLEVVKFHKIRL